LTPPATRATLARDAESPKPILPYPRSINDAAGRIKQSINHQCSWFKPRSSMKTILILPIAAWVFLGQSLAMADAPAAAGAKSRPGHYVAVEKLADREEIKKIASLPGVAGIQKRYPWRKLEPVEDKYDFTEIEGDLQALAEVKKQLVVFIEDKSFNQINPLPDYLPIGQYAFKYSAKSTGFISKRWDPYVVSRFAALFAALGQQFDQHPNFEGIAIQETAIGVDERTRKAHGYTPEKYRDALIQICLGAKQALPNSQVFWYMNFLRDGQSMLADVAAAIAPKGIAMGGPDILPNSQPLVKNVYPLYQQFKGRMPLFCCAQNDSFRHQRRDSTDQKYWAMEDIFLWAKDRLHASYVFWNYKKTKAPAASHNFDDAIPIFKNHPTWKPS
jgi:hypothetical protein